LPVYGFTQNLAINIISVILGLAGILLTYRAWHNAMRAYYAWPLMPVDVRTLQIPVHMQESGYMLMEREGVPGDALLTSEKINHALLGGVSSELKVDESVFQARHPEPIGEILLNEFTREKGRRAFNGKKVRLASEPLWEDDRLAVSHIQPTYYFDTLVTNDALDVSIKFGASQRKVYDGHDYCFLNNIIPECSSSLCANQIGTSTIAFTSDGYLVIVGQSEPNAFSKKLWAPSGSGSADWKDVGTFRDLQQFVKFAAGRELAEECGLSVNDIACLRIFGYGRLLHRAGLPQFFCLARLNCTYAKVRRTRSERPFIDFHQSIYFEQQRSNSEAIQRLRQELRENRNYVSSALWYCAELLSRMPEDDLEKTLSRP
jgi:hypothetical protein